MSHRLGISRLRGTLHGDEAGRRNPFAVFRLGHKRSQTKALKKPGETPAWSGTYQIDDVDYDLHRDLQVTLYDSTPSGAVAVGSGYLHLDAKTLSDAEIELTDKSNASVGRLKFHLDTHGYLLERPVTKQVTRAEVPAGVEVLHTEILETGEIEAPTTPPAKAASMEYVMVSEGDTAPVCGSRTYTVIEDRPVEKERHTTILEHHAWEKTFAIETRLVSERELTDQAKVEVISRAERVIAVARSDPCVGAPELVLDTA